MNRPISLRRRICAKSSEAICSLHPAAIRGGEESPSICRISSDEQVDFSEFADMSESHVGRILRVRGRIHKSRCLGALTFMTIRIGMRFCQAVLSRHQTPQAAALSKLVQSLQLESVVDILGYVQESKAADALHTGGVELAVVRLTLLSRSKKGPFSVEDASRFIQNDFLKPDNAVETPHPAKPALKTSFVPTSLRQDYRVLDLRVPANIAIFRIESQISSSFRDFFLHRGFVEIHSPKLLPAVQPEQFGDFK